MSRSKRKLTMKEVEEHLNTMAQRQNQMAGIVQALMNEAEKQNTIMLHFLMQEGLIETRNCPECEGEINFPVLQGLERDKECPYCGKDLDGNQEKLPIEEEE